MKELGNEVWVRTALKNQCVGTTIFELDGRVACEYSKIMDSWITVLFRCSQVSWIFLA